MTRTFDIIVCDEKDFMREKIAGVLSRIGMVRIVGQAAEVAAMKNVVGKFCPDIILIDLLLAAAEAETVAEVMKICTGAILLLYSGDLVEYQDFASQIHVGKRIRINDIETEVIKYCVRQRTLEKRVGNALLQQVTAAHKEAGL